jgi:glycosyltransferase involved in cell wall biosynthesis
MSKTLDLGYRYLKKFGLRRFLAALLMYSSRQLSREIDVSAADRITSGSTFHFIDRQLVADDFTERDLRENERIVESWKKADKRSVASVNWFVPDFPEVYAGIMNIFRFADYLGRKGIRNNFIIIGENPSTEDLIASKLGGRFPALRGARTYRNPELNSIPYAEVSFATFWATAYPLLKFNNTLGKFYFIQDNEALFYEAGPWSALAELTYHFGFQGITTAQPLKDWYFKTYGGEAVAFNPCVDTTLYYPDVKKPREKLQKIFFFARPLMPRNGFDLGILSLESIKKSHPEIEIVTAGANLERWDIREEIKHLGFLSLEDTAQLYRSCDAALYLMFTLHPGVIPFELMASGCAVVTNDYPAHRSVLRNGRNCILCTPTVTGIVESFERLHNNYPLRRELFENGLKTTVQNSWDAEMERGYKFVTGTQD